MDKEGSMEARMAQGVSRAEEDGENEEGCSEVHDQTRVFP